MKSPAPSPVGSLAPRRYGSNSAAAPRARAPGPVPQTERRPHPAAVAGSAPRPCRPRAIAFAAFDKRFTRTWSSRPGSRSPAQGIDRLGPDRHAALGRERADRVDRLRDGPRRRDVRPRDGGLAPPRCRPCPGGRRRADPSAGGRAMTAPGPARPVVLDSLRGAAALAGLMVLSGFLRSCEPSRASPRGPAPPPAPPRKSRALSMARGRQRSGKLRRHREVLRPDRRRPGLRTAKPARPARSRARSGTARTARPPPLEELHPRQQAGAALAHEVSDLGEQLRLAGPQDPPTP